MEHNHSSADALRKLLGVCRQLISELTPHERLLLLDKLTGRDIAQCWAFASLLYDAPGKTREHAQGGWNLADDFPRLPEEVILLTTGRHLL